MSAKITMARGECSDSPADRVRLHFLLETQTAAESSRPPNLALNRE